MIDSPVRENQSSVADNNMGNDVQAVEARPLPPITPLPGNSDDSRISATSAPQSLAPVRAEDNMPMVWNAKAGEDLRVVLARWSANAGYDLQWQADQAGRVAQDVHITGNFEDAVKQLLAESGAGTGVAGRVDSPQGSRDLTGRTSWVPPVNLASTMWTAPVGANIQTVIEQWALRANVTVVWQQYMNIAVKRPVSVNGDFGAAVQSLLDQYANDAARPVAQLNTDPDSGRRTLMIDLDKS